MFVQTAFYSELKCTRSCWWANIINVYYLTTLLRNISEFRVKYLFFNSSASMAHAYVRHESCQQLPGETVRNTLNTDFSHICFISKTSETSVDFHMLFTCTLTLYLLHYQYRTCFGSQLFCLQSSVFHMWTLVN